MDLTPTFLNCPDYVLLRHSKEFPIINRGQDVDILVRSIPDWIGYLTDFMRQYPGKIVSYQLTPKHHQVDYYFNGFRHKYDLYSELIDSAFTDDIFKSKRLIREKFIVPSVEMDRLTKCYELVKYGKSKYCDYEIYKGGLDHYEYK